MLCSKDKGLHVISTRASQKFESVEPFEECGESSDVFGGALNKYTNEENQIVNQGILSFTLVQRTILLNRNVIYFNVYNDLKSRFAMDDNTFAVIFHLQLRF